MTIVDLEAVFERLASFPILTFEKGDIVLADGSTTGRLLFLIQGELDVIKDEWHIARVTEPGAVFGDMAALRGQPHSADVRAVQPSSFFVIHDAASFLRTEPLIALYVATIQSGRLDAGNRHLIAARSQIAAKGQRHRTCLAALDRIGGALHEASPATAASAIAVTTAAPPRPPEQVIGAQLLDPGSMTSMVGIMSVLQTSDAVCAAIQEVTGAVGKPSDISQVSYRFVVNRVLLPMINEAINCLHDGLAKPGDVDAVLELGAKPPVGPLGLADRIGLDLVLDLMDILYEATDDPGYLPSPLLRQLVASGYLGRKSGRGFYKYDQD
jgi:CRP-like cAMP-binding protein